MEPIVAGYLLDHSFKQLLEEHGVRAKVGAQKLSSMTKFSLNYDQTMTKAGDELAEQCRGLVVRPHNVSRIVTSERPDEEIVGPVDVLAWPMNRFYNHGDQAAARVDWLDPALRVYEKLDGTMIVLYWDEMKELWCTATRSSPEADVPATENCIQEANSTFCTLFYRALRDTYECWFNASAHGRDHREPRFIDVHSIGTVMWLNQRLTYVFELTTPVNRIVVNYPKYRVTLLAARDTTTGEEIPLGHDLLRETVERINLPRIWSIGSLDELARFVSAQRPDELEGAVVVDSKFRRIKVKNVEWGRVAKAKNTLTVSTRNVIRWILKGSIDDEAEFLSDDIRSSLVSLRQSLERYTVEVDARHQSMLTRALDVEPYLPSPVVQRKAFAGYVKECPDPSVIHFGLLKQPGWTTMQLLTSMAASGRLTDGLIDELLKRITAGTPAR